MPEWRLAASLLSFHSDFMSDDTPAALRKAIGHIDDAGRVLAARVRQPGADKDALKSLLQYLSAVRGKLADAYAESRGAGF